MKHYRYLRTITGLKALFQKNTQTWNSVSSRCLLFQSNRTFKFSQTHMSSFNSDNDNLFEEDFEQEDFLQDVLLYNPLLDHNQQKEVVVIMPRQKAGVDKKTKERGQFLLEETIVLTESISGWKVVGNHMISTAHISSKTIFGKINLGYLKDYVQSVNANAVVFALDILTPVQHHYFSQFLNVDVHDRFSVVLKIFQERASTKETKLQLSLAELNYVKKNLHYMKECDFSEFTLAKSFGGGFDSFFQVKKKLIQEKELKLKRLLDKVEKNNLLKKQHRMKIQIPSVAIVGYTNSGKTSLIKALTHDSKLVPEDRLFATLDVSVHMANLPSNLKVLLIDTIGFITEIPTALIHSFRSTLSELCTADLLIHVVNCSHPDWQVQKQTVLDTLQEINVPEKLFNSIIEVSNKIDKIDPKMQDQLLAENHLLVSATERIGLDQLETSIEKAIIANTDRLMFKIRVPNGGDHYQWLYREAAIVECKPDNDENYMIMNVIVTKSKLGKFMKHFNMSFKS